MTYKLIIMWNDLWPLVLFLLFFLFDGLRSSVHERKLWNGGICPQTEEPWKLHGIAGLGDRGYNSGNHYIWISYPGIDN